MNEWLVVAVAIAFVASVAAFWAALHVSAQFQDLRSEVRHAQAVWIKDTGLLENRCRALTDELARQRQAHQALRTATEAHAKVGYRDGHG